MLHSVDWWLVTDIPVTNDQSALHNIPDERRSNFNCGGSLKSPTGVLFSEVKRPGREAGHLHILLSPRMSGDFSSSPPTRFHSVHSVLGSQAQYLAVQMP